MARIFCSFILVITLARCAGVAIATKPVANTDDAKSGAKARARAPHCGLRALPLREQSLPRVSFRSDEAFA